MEHRQTEFNSTASRTRSIVRGHPELAFYSRGDVGDGFVRQLQSLGDVSHPVTVGQQAQHLEIARGQAVERAGRFRPLSTMAWAMAFST